MGKKYIELSFKEAVPHIAEGDIILFRGKGIISWFIGKFGGSKYSHVGVASWHGFNGSSILEIIEMRELIGSRSTSLESQVKRFPGQIDIFRPQPTYYSNYFNKKENKVIDYKLPFDGKRITACMRNLTGQDYNYGTIWQILKSKLFGFRLFTDFDSMSDDKLEMKGDKYVCSTMLAKCLSSNGYDIIKNKADQFIEPGDFAKSTYLDYLFTLKV